MNATLDTVLPALPQILDFDPVREPQIRNGVVIPQITFQDMYFLRDPLKNDVKYQASAQPFLVLGMLVTGLALGQGIL